MIEYEEGALRLFFNNFITVYVSDLDDAIETYDKFLKENTVFFADLEVYEDIDDGEGFNWNTWYDEETGDDFSDVLKKRAREKSEKDNEINELLTLIDEKIDALRVSTQITAVGVKNFNETKRQLQETIRLYQRTKEIRE